MEKLLISACLLGVASRYDGRSVEKLTPADLDRLTERYALVPFCPEVYGGLTTPRLPSEIRDGGVFMVDGTDVTDNYNRGAEQTLRLCEKLGIKKALLKEKSPSCGKGEIYDGSYSGVLTEGDGVTAALLCANGIEVFGESRLDELMK
jgi:uncharacterized protein YbbK (DUF523 family)